MNDFTSAMQQPHRVELDGRGHLHIGQLSLDGGELKVDGRIDSLSYEEPAAARGGLLRRLLG